MKNIRNRLKPYARLLEALLGFWYDFTRFYRYSAWRSNMMDNEQRNYHVAKIYHALEKSMSFKERKDDAGWAAAHELLNVLRDAKKASKIGFHDKKALIILSKFAELDNSNNNSELIRNELLNFDFMPNEVYKTKIHKLEDFTMGVIDQPERFFFSRFSLREFKDEIVPENVIKRAVSLALKTPSVCNRQAWHIYHTFNHDVKISALKYQTGSKSFGEKIPNLMIITADLKAFMSGKEHYQYWIDGGMFAMSIVYALHSLGVASCCLNWSQSPANDKRVRSLIDIKPNQTIVMMIAVGWPDELNNVCVSERRPLDEVYSTLILRKENI